MGSAATPAGGGSRPWKKQASTRPLSASPFLAVFLGVVLSFVGATIYARAIERTIHGAATEIADNAAPSIETLGKARADLRHIETLVEKVALAEGNDLAKLDEIARLRARFGEEIDANLALPTFPDERRLWRDVAREIFAAEDVCDRILVRSQRGDASGAAELARSQLPAAVDRAALAIGRSLELNAGEARELARSIEATRARSTLVVGVLDGVCAVLALAAAYLLFRIVQRHTALLTAHQRLTEERAEELEQFAGRVAHDIMSPLSAAVLALALAEQSMPEGHPARTRVGRGQRSLQSMKQVADALLEFAKAGARPSADARTEVGTVVEDVCADARPDAQVARVELVVEPFTPCTVGCDPGILTSIVSNLVRNAVKYMGERAERRVTVRVRDRVSSIRIEVADTGPGIPLQLQAHIFEPYVRGPGAGKKEGIGLGLATVKRIVEAHEGSLGLESSPGRGSMFWVELPKPPPEARGAVSMTEANAA